MIKDSEVIFAALRLSRAMRRCPPDFGERPFPPAVGRMLVCVQANPGVSSRELCEMLDLRPSSLSEMLTRAEESGWLTRTADPEDKRVQHIDLTERGKQLLTGLEAMRETDAARKTACFTEAEKKQFAALCGRLSDHLERLAPDQPLRGPRGPQDPHGPGREPGPRRERRRPPEVEHEGFPPGTVFRA